MHRRGSSPTWTDCPVGWVGVGVRTETPRLMNSRTIPLVDEQPVWAIGCFRIRPGYRRRGIATALLVPVSWFGWISPRRECPHLSLDRDPAARPSDRPRSIFLSG
ncbi:MAG: GNAT family N-acetyltransferase [Actinomycetota bacterium]